MPGNYDIPTYVLLYLNKGAKYVHDRHASHVKDIIASISQLQRSLMLAAHFQNNTQQTSKPASKCKLRSSWQPPSNSSIDSYCSLLRNRLVSQYSSRKQSSNTTWLDKQAAAWLRSHKDDLVVVDADKGLGDVIVPRSWVQAELRRLLGEGFRLTDSIDYTAKLIDAKVALETITTEARNRKAISKQEAAFIMHTSNSTSNGRFRLRIKIHKQPNKGRPIANLSRSWLQPVALFLCQCLAPLQSALAHVVTSSYDFINKISSISDSIPSNHRLATVDAVNLYPSIDQSHLINVLTTKIMDFYNGKLAFAQYVVQLLRILTANQFVEHDGMFWQASGIATGLPPGVFLANIYLSALDEDLILHLGSSISFYKRFVDDSIICASPQAIDDTVVYQNSWHKSIKWEVTARSEIHADSPVPFLDLELTIQQNIVALSNLPQGVKWLFVSSTE
eukprot:TRINITY_DN2963_c0_g1_i1.p1 TRINITY_DN2963_c0_g1~~TRINITY_DN2963_c0_g1_i1.p1  ORF type:complete len:448 (-),score=41.85 TRINITY_DN2963_c0_g1_i1:682-2025(-)